MNAATLNLGFDDIARLACEDAESPSAAGCESVPALRIALLYGEELRIPKSVGRLLVLSGTAWVSFEAKDHVLERGESMDFAGASHRAVVSPLCGEAAFLELT